MTFELVILLIYSFYIFAISLFYYMWKKTDNNKKGRERTKERVITRN